MIQQQTKENVQKAMISNTFKEKKTVLFSTAGRNWTDKNLILMWGDKTACLH